MVLRADRITGYLIKDGDSENIFVMKKEIYLSRMQSQNSRPQFTDSSMKLNHYQIKLNAILWHGLVIFMLCYTTFLKISCFFMLTNSCIIKNNITFLHIRNHQNVNRSECEYGNFKSHHISTVLLLLLCHNPIK